MTRPPNDNTKAHIAMDTLMLRLPAVDIKAVKLAAIQLDFPTFSQFMITCFREYMKARKS